MRWQPWRSSSGTDFAFVAQGIERWFPGPDLEFSLIADVIRDGWSRICHSEVR